jgi:hypothetical protein
MPENRTRDGIPVAAGDATATGGGGRDQLDVAAEAAASTDRDNAAAQSEVTDKAWEIRFRIGISRRYNSRLADHYGRLDNLATVINLIGGSAAFANMLGQQTELALYASLSVMVMSAFSLSFRWTDKARLHDDLYRQYTRLNERLIRAGDDALGLALREIEADFVTIEASEPAIRNALMIVCHNEEVEAQGATGKHPLRWWQRMFATVVTLPPRSWEK